MATDLQNEILGQFHDFEFSLHDVPLKKQVRPIGVFCGVYLLCVATTLFLSAWVWSPPSWLQPSIVGMLWASLFLAGAAAGSVRRGNLQFALIAGCYVWLSQLALQSMTSLTLAECGLIVVCTFSAGWLVTQFEFSGRMQGASASEVRRYQQWTIWDLALLTTLVAVTCYALPRLESPLVLLTQVGFVMLGGWVCSWLAYRWVFDDCWTISKLVAMISASSMSVWLGGFWLVSQQSSNELLLWHITSWMLTGPVAVIAAQGLTVLAALTAIRIDQGSLFE